jgi:hypothetical protein
MEHSNYDIELYPLTVETKMNMDVLKTEKFSIIFSAMIGFAIATLAIPVCKGDDCMIKKAPSVEEMKTSTFRIGSKCYQFKPEIVSCPAKGVIEAYTNWTA